nr:rep protein [Cressdnaviricota sp.]UOF82677.1 rep protein [Cressdnaviricota sp.]
METLETSGKKEISNNKDKSSGGSGAGAGPVILKAPARYRMVPGRRFAFTFFPPENVEIMETLELIKSKLISKNLKFIVGIEICPTTLKTHFQGYIESSKKIRPNEYIGLDKSTHWEKAKACKEANIKYCMKENNFITNFSEEDDDNEDDYDPDVDYTYNTILNHQEKIDLNVEKFIQKWREEITAENLKFNDDFKKWREERIDDPVYADPGYKDRLKKLRESWNNKRS